MTRGTYDMDDMMDDIPLLSKDQQIDWLLERLSTTEDPDDATDAETELWSLWSESGDESADRMLDSATLALRDHQLESAMALMNAVVEMAPNFAEGWNRRATLHIIHRNYKAAMRDLNRSLELEPRHFGALWSLSTVHEAMGHKEKALTFLHRAKRLNPHIEGAEARMDYLQDIIVAEDD